LADVASYGQANTRRSLPNPDLNLDTRHREFDGFSECERDILRAGCGDPDSGVPARNDPSPIPSSVGCCEPAITKCDTIPLR